MDFIADLTQKFSTELLEVAGKTGTILGEIVPEPITDFTGHLLVNFFTVIAPIWNPLWTAFNELIDILFGFPI